MNHYSTCAARVLVVSDWPTIADTISDLLKNNLCRAEPVKGASQALRRIQSSPPDIVLLDSVAEPGRSQRRQKIGDLRGCH